MEHMLLYTNIYSYIRIWMKMVQKNNRRHLLYDLRLLTEKVINTGKIAFKNIIDVLAK